MVHQRKLENVEYFRYFGSMITSNEMCTHEIKSRISVAKAAFKKKKKKKKKTLFASKLDLNERKKPVEWYIYIRGWIQNFPD